MDICRDLEGGQEEIQIDPQEPGKPMADKAAPEKSVSLFVLNLQFVWGCWVQVETFMDDIEDEFFANLSQATIDTAIEVCFLVCAVFGIFVVVSGRKKEN